MATEGPAPSAEDKARYEAAKKELIMALTKKRAIDKQLSQLEVQIYQTEATYLTETSAQGGGNIIQGFENYLKNTNLARKRTEVTDADRMFSTSSMTYQKSLDLMGEGDESAGEVDENTKAPTPGLTTVIVPPARSQELSAAQQKKNRDREYQRRKRANMSRRSTTGQESDEESVSASGRKPSKRARLGDDD